jgi:hypothetical protein
MLLVAAVVIAVAGFSVYRLSGIFGSENDTSADRGISSAITPFHPKEVVLEIFGAPGTMATINYLDVDAQPQQAVDAALPWSHTITTTQPAVFANVVAQGDSDSIGCRITVNGVVTDERIVTRVNAYTFCLDKSS